MKHRVLRSLPLWVAVGSVLAIAACGGSSSNTASSSNTSNCTVVFGSDTEISGPAQVYGQPAAQGLDVAAKAINAAGGVKVGNKTCKFVAANQDNKSDPAQVFTAAQKVVDAHAIAALGPDFNDTVAYAAYKKAGVIDFITGGTTSVKLHDDPAGTPLAVAMIPFQVLEHEAYLRQAMAAAQAEGHPIKSMAVMFPNTASGKENVQGSIVPAAKAIGLPITNTVMYPDSTKDYSTYLTNVAKGHPDLLYAGESSQQSTTIMQQSAPLNVAKYYLSETATAESVQATSGLSKVTVFLPTFAPTYSSAEVLPTDHPEVIFGNSKPPLVPGAAIVLYYAAWLTKQAVEKAGTATDPNKVLAALIGQSYDGPFGRCTMTKQRFMECATVFIVVKGKQVTVQQFATPYDTTPAATYDCVNGKCTKQ
jgi:ABC-type branched-subunit amino acid transport system substrate-binding protein